MPPLSFTDEELNVITALAAALPHSMRSEFLQRVANKISTHQVRGAGLVYRTAADVQRALLRGGSIAVGVSKPGKYGRSSPRQERRR
jgi:hypothetical protein